METIDIPRDYCANHASHSATFALPRKVKHPHPIHGDLEPTLKQKKNVRRARSRARAQRRYYPTQIFLSTSYADSAGRVRLLYPFREVVGGR